MNSSIAWVYISVKYLGTLERRSGWKLGEMPCVFSQHVESMVGFIW